MQQAMNVRKVAVLPRKEWDQIKSRIAERTDGETRFLEKVAERERLHQKSIEVVKNWQNTIQGQRQRKIEARQLRQEAEEEKLQHIDREEAKFQQAKRKESIDKAKTLQYYQTDRVKSFHAAVILSEVLKERDAQVKMRREIAAMQKQREINLESKYFESFNKEVENEKMVREKAMEQTVGVAEYQSQQRRLKAEKLHEELLEGIKLGQNLQERDEDHVQLMKNRQEAQLTEKKALMRDIVDQIHQKAKMHELDALLRDVEDKEIKIFEQAKNEMKRTRKRREEEVQTEKHRQRDLLVQKLNNQKQDYDRVVIQRREIDQKINDEARNKREAQKLSTTLREQEDIKKHRENEQTRISTMIEHERQANIANLKSRIEIDNNYHAKEKEIARQRRLAARDLKDAHFKQINVHAANERQDIDDELKCFVAQNKAQELEEEEFKKYSSEVIVQGMKSNIRNYVYPLIKAANAGTGGGHGPKDSSGTRPSFMSCDGNGVQLPAYHKDTAEATKKIYAPKDINHAKKRFGFVW